MFHTKLPKILIEICEILGSQKKCFAIIDSNKNLSLEDASPDTSKATQPKKPKNLKRKLSASNLLASELPTAKKAKKSSTPKIIKKKSGGTSKTTPRGTSKTAPGGTPKKYASEPHTKLPRGE